MKTKDGKYECDNCYVDVGEKQCKELGGAICVFPPNIVPEKLREKIGFEHLCKTCFDALRVEMIKYGMCPTTVVVPVDSK